MYIKYMIVALIMFSCRHTEIQQSSDLINIDLNNFYSKFNSSEIIEKITYIPLETSEDCLIGDISKILYKNNKIFIGDFRFTKSIFIFDNNGNYLNKISALGQGPGEYISINTFDVMDDFIYIYAYSKICIYNTSGFFIEEVKTDIKAFDFSVVSPSEFAFYKLIDGINISHCLSLYRTNPSSLDKYIPNRGKVDDIKAPRFVQSNFFRSDSVLFFANSFSNIIYKLHNEGLVEEYVKLVNIDEFFQIDEKVNSLVSTSSFDIVKGISYERIPGIRSFFENNDDIFFSFSYKGAIFRFRYSKVGNNIVSTDFQNQEVFFILDYFGVWDRGFISYVPSNMLSEEFIENVNISASSELIKDAFASKNVNSNPIIAFVEVLN